MGNELAGKVAVVTGGASGLGAGIVERFLAEGATVVFGDIDADQGQALADGHPQALFVPTDVADTAQLTRLIDTAVERFGRLDVMVNNAGISHKMHRSFLDDDLAEFEKVMAVNLKAVMSGTRDAARQMKAGGEGGSIINLTSIGGIQAGGGVMTYRASKAAVIHFTQCAAIELARYEIRVNCLAPGHIRTAIVSKSAHGMDAEQVAKFEAGIRATMRADRPLEREGTAADVAEAILFFAGDRSPYVTGTVLPVDGGTSAGKPVPKKKKPEDA